MQGEEACGKTAATCAKTDETSARTAETFGVIDEISGRTVDQERARKRLHKTGETFAKARGNSGKLVGSSGRIAKTGVKTGETCGPTWPAAEATAVKYSNGQEKPAATEVAAGFFYGEIFCPTGMIRHSRPSSSSITSAQVETGGRELTETPRFVATSCSRP